MSKRHDQKGIGGISPDYCKNVFLGGIHWASYWSLDKNYSGTLYGKSRMCSVSFYLMDWVPAQSKERSASNILKNISWIEFIITWKSLFWFCLNWIHSLLGYFIYFPVLSNSHSFAQCILLRIWAFIHSLNRQGLSGSR